MNHHASTREATMKRILAIGIKSFAFVAYRTRLKELGVEIDDCESNAKAVDIMRSRRYDVVIIQLMNAISSLRDGLEILDFVREEQPQTKVLVISTCGNAIEKEKIYKQGAAYYLDAPVFAPDVFKALRELSVLSGNGPDYSFA